VSASTLMSYIDANANNPDNKMQLSPDI